MVASDAIACGVANFRGPCRSTTRIQGRCLYWRVLTGDVHEGSSLQCLMTNQPAWHWPSTCCFADNVLRLPRGFLIRRLRLGKVDKFSTRPKLVCVLASRSLERVPPSS